MSDQGNHFEDPVARRDAHYRNVREFKEETRRRSDALRAEIARLKDKRQELRMSAATSAGVIGLRYLADTNSYVRLVGAVDEEIVLPESIARPDPLPPEEVPAVDEPGPNEKRSLAMANEAWLRALGALLWCFAVVVGLFVGVGLLTIVGFSIKVDAWYLVPALFVGFSVVGGLKVMVHVLWHGVGREKALGDSSVHKLLLAAVLTAGGCYLDAHLGASAFRQYLEGRTFNATDLPSYWQLFLLAMAITSPLLLGSAALAFEKGRREPSREEREEARVTRERERLEQARRERTEKEAAARQRHRDGLQAKIDGEYQDQLSLVDKKYEERKRLDDERAEDWADLKNNAEFKCLQGLIGQIGVLNVEIAEKERDLTNYKISRGFEKSGEFPNGRATPQASEGESKDEEKAEGKGDGEAFTS